MEVRTVDNLCCEPPCTSGREYLSFMVHRLLDYRRPELEAVASMEGVSKEQLVWRRPVGNVEYSPFWYITLPSEKAAKAISKRMLLTKVLLEVWGEGSTWDELQADVQCKPQELIAPWIGPDRSFKVIVDGFGRTVTMEEQLDFIQKLEFIPFKGPVRLKDPDTRFWLIVCDCVGNASVIEEELPYRLYLGREVGAADRSILDTYSLKKRLYLGPTSMDCEMALLMCNQAKLKRGHFMFDPYAGTGSILVAAGYYGAHVMGADIDVRVIKEGKVGRNGERLTIHSNFQQYGLPLPVGLLRMDAHRHPIRPDLQELFDAVIGDPPYGVRAGGRKSAPREGVLIRNRATYIPSTQPYTMGECLRDLLDMAARLLTVGGRLVYFMPATPETYREEEVPTHPALELVANSEQLLTTRYSRRLITMEKVRRYDADAAAAHHAARPDPTMAIDRIHEIVYENYYDESGKWVGDDKPKNTKKCRGKQF